MKVKNFALVLILAFAASCNSNTSSSSAGNTKTDSTAKTAGDTKQDNNMGSTEAADSVRHAALNQLVIANTNDPSCDMPVARGFDDTATYDGKLIGFCSKECRDEFMKNPGAHKVKYKNP